MILSLTRLYSSVLLYYTVEQFFLCMFVRTVEGVINQMNTYTAKALILIVFQIQKFNFLYRISKNDILVQIRLTLIRSSNTRWLQFSRRFVYLVS